MGIYQHECDCPQCDSSGVAELFGDERFVRALARAYGTRASELTSGNRCALLPPALGRFHREFEDGKHPALIDPGLMAVADLAERVGLSDNVLYEMADNGVFPFVDDDDEVYVRVRPDGCKPSKADLLAWTRRVLRDAADRPGPEHGPRRAA
jgi:hypothetical protein